MLVQLESTDFSWGQQICVLLQRQGSCSSRSCSKQKSSVSIHWHFLFIRIMPIEKLTLLPSSRPLLQYFGVQYEVTRILELLRSFPPNFPKNCQETHEIYGLSFQQSCVTMHERVFFSEGCSLSICFVWVWKEPAHLSRCWAWPLPRTWLYLIHFSPILSSLLLSLQSINTHKLAIVAIEERIVNQKVCT